MSFKIYSLCEVTLGVKCEVPQQGAELEQLWRAIFSLSELADPDTAPSVFIRIKRAEHLIDRPAEAEKIADSRRLSVWKTPAGFFLQCGASVLDLNLSRSQAEGVIDQNFWDYALEDKREFFLLSFLMLLCPHGRYGLHANCVVKEKTGLLIVGGSGCGKTTLTVGLLCAGWSYLADDALMLRRVSRGIEALALRRGISCTPQTTVYFPELSIKDHETLVLAEGKRWVQTEPLYPERFNQQCLPQILLFPQVTGRKHSQLIPLDETRAMTGLIQQSPGIMSDKPLVRKQLETLRLLIKQSTSYQLLVGTDVYEDPTAVSNLLWENRRV